MPTELHSSTSPPHLLQFPTRRESFRLQQFEESVLTTKKIMKNGDDDATMIRLPLVVAGAGRLAHYGCSGDCTIHRTGRIYRYRRWMFQNLFGNAKGTKLSQLPARKGQITISLPGANTHSDDEDFSTLIPALQEKYGKDRIKIVVMASLSLQEQVSVASQSHVYLSNSGGGSATSLFLQRGSSLILFHRPKRMDDIDLYSTQGYFHVEWCEIGKLGMDEILDRVEAASVETGIPEAGSRRGLVQFGEHFENENESQ